MSTNRHGGFGLNPLTAFIGSGVMARLMSVIKIDGTSLQALSYRTFFEPFFVPHAGSFLWHCRSC